MRRQKGTFLYRNHEMTEAKSPAGPLRSRCQETALALNTALPSSGVPRRARYKTTITPSPKPISKTPHPNNRGSRERLREASHQLS